MALDDHKMDRTHFSIGSRSELDDAVTYWWSKTPYEGLCAVEFLRQVAYGYDPAYERLQRVLTLAKRERG
jgi:hypothetical protein